jgi:hypothetical protein
MSILLLRDARSESRLLYERRSRKLVSSRDEIARETGFDGEIATTGEIAKLVAILAISPPLDVILLRIAEL